MTQIRTAYGKQFHIQAQRAFSQQILKIFWLLNKVNEKLCTWLGREEVRIYCIHYMGASSLSRDIPVHFQRRVARLADKTSDETYRWLGGRSCDVHCEERNNSRPQNENDKLPSLEYRLRLDVSNKIVGVKTRNTNRSTVD